MSNLPSFSNLTPAFPQEALDHLHAIDVNLSYTQALKEIGYDHDIEAPLYEDQFGNVFALIFGELLALYSVNKKGNPYESIFFFPYMLIPSSNPLKIQGILKNSFKNTGVHGRIYMKAADIQSLEVDSFSGFHGELFFIDTADIFSGKTDTYIMAFRDAVGGSIYLDDSIFESIKGYLQLKEEHYYLPGTPMMIKPKQQSFKISDLSIDTVSLREYYYIDTPSYVGFLGDMDGNYSISCSQEGENLYHGILIIRPTISSRKRVLFTKNSTFRIPRKNITINQITIQNPFGNETTPIIPYIPSMIRAISGYRNTNIGTMDLRDVPFSDTLYINGFFGLSYNEGTTTLVAISSFYNCTGTLQITSAQKTIMDTISGLIIPATVQGDTSIVGTLYGNQKLYISVPDNTPAQEETDEEVGQ